MCSILQESINNTLINEAEEIINIKNTINQVQLKKIFNIIRECKGKIITIGNGTSGLAAQKISHTFNCVGIPSFFLSPSIASHGGAGVVQPDDVMMVFSKGGKTQEINEIVPGIKSTGAKIVVVTESNDTYIAQEADYILNIIVEKEADPHNLLATSSILVTIAVFDAIAIAISQENGFSKKKFSEIHPAGKVGEVLKNK